MSLAQETVSEALLAEGFSFQAKKPCNPWQFSRAPQQRTANFLKPEEDLILMPEEDSTRDIKAVIRRPQKVQAALSSLPLHELASSSHHGTPNGSPRHEVTGCSPGIERKSSSESGKSYRSLNLSSQELWDPQTKSSASSDQKETLLPSLPHQGQAGSPIDQQHVKTTFVSVDQAMGAQANPQASRVSDTRLKDKKTVPNFAGLPHIRSKLYGSHARFSPSSTCGDLEGPTIKTPTRSQRGFRRSRSHREPRLIPKQEDQCIPAHCRERSISCASNVSRKRSFIPESFYSQTEQHKQGLMQQLVKTWNSVLQGLDDEKSKLNSIIENHQRQISRLERKLQESQQVCRKDQQHNLALEERIKACEAEKDAVSQDNERLRIELESLRETLTDSEKKSIRLSEKSKLFRSKLNQAIDEQQNLYKQSTMRCQSLFQELEAARSRQTTNSARIEEALADSQRKREALARGYHELQAQKDAESMQKDTIMSSLRQNLKEKNDELYREKQMADRLRGQIDEMQKETSYGRQAIESKMTEILKFTKQSQHNQELNNLLAGAMAEKINEVVDRLTCAVAVPRSPPGPEAVAMAIEEQLNLHLVPSITQVARQQDAFARQISDAGNCFAAELLDMKKIMAMFFQKRVEEEETAKCMKAQVFETLTALSAEVEAAREACDNILRRFDYTSASISEKLERAGEAQAEELQKKIECLHISVWERESQLQLVAKDHTAKVEDLSAQLAQQGKNAEVLIRTELSNLSRSLTETIAAQEGLVQKKLDESETMIANLRGQLDEAEGRLTDAQNHVCPDVETLKNNLDSEKNNAAQLHHELHTLKEQIAATEETTEETKTRCSQDTQTLDSLQSHVQSMIQKLDILELLQSDISGFFNLKSNVDMTAEFLAGETKWIHKELSDLGADLKPVIFSSQGQRKVTVHSPIQIARTPSPLLSVYQEQIRRREGRRPRSILKSFQSSHEVQSSDSAFREGNVDGRTLRRTLNHTQYNRPVMADASNASSISNDSSNIVENIRSEQVQAVFSQKRTLSTVAEYEKRQDSTLKHQADDEATSLHYAKRLRPESLASPQPDLGRPKLRTVVAIGESFCRPTTQSHHAEVL